MFDRALREYLKESSIEDASESSHFDLPSELVDKANAIAAKAHVDVDAIVNIALKKYFSQTGAAYEKLPTILQGLTGIQATPSASLPISQANYPLRTSRRRFGRVPVDLPIVYSITGTNMWQDARIVDLSGGGARISTAADLMRGCQLILGFNLPVSRHRIVVSGRAVMSFFDGEAKEYSHRVAFTHLAESDQEAIVAFVRDTSYLPDEV